MSDDGPIQSRLGPCDQCGAERFLYGLRWRICFDCREDVIQGLSLPRSRSSRESEQSLYMDGSGVMRVQSRPSFGVDPESER